MPHSIHIVVDGRMSSLFQSAEYSSVCLDLIFIIIIIKILLCW